MFDKVLVQIGFLCLEWFHDARMIDAALPEGIVGGFVEAVAGTDARNTFVFSYKLFCVVIVALMVAQASALKLFRFANMSFHFVKNIRKRSSSCARLSEQ